MFRLLIAIIVICCFIAFYNKMDLTGVSNSVGTKIQTEKTINAVNSARQQQEQMLNDALNR